MIQVNKEQQNGNICINLHRHTVTHAEHIAYVAWYVDATACVLRVVTFFAGIKGDVSVCVCVCFSI